MIKKYGLRMVRDKLTTVNILRKLHISLEERLKTQQRKGGIIALSWEVK
jgi:hypothetical protein